MKPELIDLGQEASLGGESAWTCVEPMTPEPVKKAAMSPQERLLREYWEAMRDHDASPLND